MVSSDEKIFTALNSFTIELPSWGFANTGTRFGKFIQPAAATTLEEKLNDSTQVHRLTGCCPTVAVHVLWDFPAGPQDARAVATLADRLGVRIGSVNPNLFQAQIYKYGSFANPAPSVRQAAVAHVIESAEIARQVGSRDVSLWLADGSNYPGTAHIRNRRQWLEEGLRQAHDALSGTQRLLLEYKPFEPAFYHTDIADWGMALLLARAAGSRARVLVDTGHHYQSQNIEQIVAWLLHDEMLGGFHFNDRRYADDDLTLGSIDPYQIFRVFCEIALFQWERGTQPDLAYMIDQSHNLKGKIEAMIQTVTTAQELFAKAALVDFGTLVRRQADCALVDAEECLKSAFYTDVRPAVRSWRKSRDLPEDPLTAFRESGYLERITRERGDRCPSIVSSYA